MPRKLHFKSFFSLIDLFRICTIKMHRNGKNGHPYSISTIKKIAIHLLHFFVSLSLWFLFLYKFPLLLIVLLILPIFFFVCCFLVSGLVFHLTDSLQIYGVPVCANICLSFLDSFWFVVIF